MPAKQRRRFTAEFKAQALQILATGKPVAELARELGIGENLLYGWRFAAHGPQGGSSEAARAGGEGNDTAAALRALQREVAILRQENDILKKAAVILGTRPQPSSGP